MKPFLLVITLAGLLTAEVSAHGGVAAVAVVRRPIVFPRVAIRRTAFVAPQAIVVAPRAIFAQPLVVPQAFVAPQAFIQPQTYVQPQAFFSQQYVVPQVQTFSTGCSAAGFFAR